MGFVYVGEVMYKYDKLLQYVFSYFGAQLLNLIINNNL